MDGIKDSKVHFFLVKLKNHNKFVLINNFKFGPLQHEISRYYAVVMSSSYSLVPKIFKWLTKMLDLTAVAPMIRFLVFFFLLVSANTFHRCRWFQDASCNPGL